MEEARSIIPVRSLQIRIAFFVLLSACALDLVAGAGPQPGKGPPPLLLRDLGGVHHRPFADPSVKAIVMVFLLTDCPIANSYAPEIKRLDTEYGPRGVRFYLVQVDPDLTIAEARAHAQQYGYTCPVVLDARHELVAHAGATRVPETAVFTPDGKRPYRGRIDNLYLAPGKRRTQPTERDLRDALEAVLAGKRVIRAVSEVVGCFIPALNPKGPEPMNRKTLLIVGALAMAAGACADTGEKPYQPRPKGAVTYTREIAPLMFKHCAACHRPGEVAPFPLLSYREVSKRAGQIHDVTARRFMPPWKAVSGHGEFRDERRLSAEEIGMLKQWADEDCSEGDPKYLPPAPKFATGWQLGTPDLVVTMPKSFTVPAEGADIYRNFVIPLQIPEGKYVRAVEYRPGNRRVVHHAGLALDTTGQIRARRQRRMPGFTQINIPGQLFPGNLAFWVPGQDIRPLPEGMALAWPKGADFVLQLHLHPSGKPETEQSTVGFYFTSDRPRRALHNFILNYTKIDIAPGEDAHRTKHTHTLKQDAEVYGIFPHMHLIGKAVTVTAHLPDGKKCSLIQIDQWEFNWQNYYVYATPVALPKGTELVMEYVHDNSAANPSNPSQPPKRVVYGLQSTNEMAVTMLTTVGSADSAGVKNGTVRDAAQLAQQALARFDKNKDGKLSLEEIRQIPGVDALDLDALIRRFDRDGDGMLNAEELAAALKALRK